MTASKLPVLRGERLVLRPLTEADVEALLAVVASEGVREWWVPEPTVDDEREALRNEGTAFAIEVDGALAGWLGVSEEDTPGYRHAGLDIILAAAFQDCGLGTEALRLAARWLLHERAHHRLTIDPAHANTRAIRAYEAIGFRPVGVMRRYERGPDGVWHDGLLMDLLAEELR